MNKKLLAVAVSGALTVPVVAQAIDFKISGHVNRMIRFADDGKGSDIQFLDNSASRTRFRFLGAQDIGNGMQAGIRIETSVASNVSGKTPLKDTGSSFDTAVDIRHSALYFDGRWGRLTMGHTSTATDGIAFADLSGTALVDEVSSAELASAVAWRTSGGDSFASIGASRTSGDGDRRDTLRYDSPALGPVTIAASVSDRSVWGVGAYLDHDFSIGSFSLYGGYEDREPAEDLEQWAVSTSFLHNSGFNITGSFGSRDNKEANSKDPFNWYVKGGYKWGNNAISGSYGDTQRGLNCTAFSGALDCSAGLGGSADSRMWGLGYVYTMKKPGIEFYAGYKNFDLDLRRCSCP